jgi:starch-binding outer membrane protein, SusD/RagB family
MSMPKRIPEIVGVLALILAGGCDTLNIQNPNAPDTPHLLASPASVEAVAQGAFKTWYLTTQGGLGEDQYPEVTLAVMARSHVAMWNNFHIRFYTGCTDGTFAGQPPLPWNGYTAATGGTCGAGTLEGPHYPRVEWQNNPAAAERTQIEAFWYGYYSSLSSARDVLKRIRVDGLVITDAATTKMVETMTVLAQALSLSGLAMNYDHAFIVDYNSDLTTLKFSTALELRDVAMAKFDTAITMATANTFTTADGFFGPGVTYTNVQVAQIANTMAARTLAYFPRNAAQNATVEWARVAGYASKGISSGTVFNWQFKQDACNTWCDFLKVWSNDFTTVRVHSRVAHLLDPASQPDPWDPTTNTHPNSPDKRLGDGTYRGGANVFQSDVLNAYPDTNCAKPTGCTGGTDFVWTHISVFGRTNRGAWHQSPLGQIRYDSLAGCGDNPQGSSSPGSLNSPMVLAAENDLIWAEALIRGPTPNLAQAATLINKTHVGRGGLTPSTGTLADLQYEQDVELLGSNDAPYYNQRRIDGLEPLTPHEMPVPAKELGVLGIALYTCGGANHPDGSCDTFPAPSLTVPVAGAAAAVVANAPKVWAQLEQEWQNRMAANRVLNRLTKN